MKDLIFGLEAGVVDPLVQATALERIVHLSGAVGGDDHERRLLCADGADLGNGDLEVGQDLQQKALKLFIGAVDLVNQ